MIDYINLIESLRVCGEHRGCVGCPNSGKYAFNDCAYVLNLEAARAVEKLLAENAELKTDIDYTVAANTELYGALPRWVSADEQLPENFRPVLCWYEYYHWSDRKMLPEYGVGYCVNGRWGGEVSNGIDAKVLFWMLLPEPPKEKNNA